MAYIHIIQGADVWFAHKMNRKEGRVRKPQHQVQHRKITGVGQLEEDDGQNQSAQGLQRISGVGGG